jgi:hypothetical protein
LRIGRGFYLSILRALQLLLGASNEPLQGRRKRRIQIDLNPALTG